MNSYSQIFERIMNCPQFDSQPYSSGVRPSVSFDKLRHLFTDCFSHHTKYHNHKVRSLSWDPGDATRIMKRDILGAYFVATKYRLPEITCREQNSAVSYQAFINDLHSSSFSEDNNIDRFLLGSNRTRYIVGDVGSGKSSFIQRLMNDLEKLNDEDKRQYNNICVYIDAEDILNPHGDAPSSIDDNFYCKVFESMITAAEGVDQAVTASTSYSLTGLHRPIHAIKCAVADMKDLGHRFTIFIDNLDFYHYYYARYSFFEEYKLNQDKAIYDNIAGLLKTLSSPQYLGFLGLNIVVAFRDSVWQHVISQAPGVRNERDTAQTVRLETISEDQVIGSRIELFREACGVYAAHAKQSAASSLLRLSADVETMFLQPRQGHRKSAVSTIYSLGQHGYRSLVEFFSGLNISPVEHELFERFLTHQSDVLISLYINKHRKKYTQSLKHFPNMFLVDCIVAKNPLFPTAHQSHVHTYWAKYLILKYISKKKRCKVKEVIDLFTFGENGYEEHVLRHCLGSLCTANESRCVELEYGGEPPDSVDSMIVRMTTRGEAVLATHYGTSFCFSYRYLSSIIDDKWLSVPKVCMEKIYHPSLSLEHVYYSGDVYSLKSAAFVAARSIQVAYFVRILASSWSAEFEMLRTGLGKRLEQLGMKPDFNAMQNELYAAVEAILSKFDKGENNAGNCVKAMSAIFSGADEVANSLSVAIKEYYSNPDNIN